MLVTMKSNLIFQDEIELHRLSVQNQLLSDYEKPIIRDMLQEKTKIRILDVGCNDGRKTVDRFSGENIYKVIGLEFHQELVEKAENEYSDKVYSFYQCDIEASDFEERLSDIASKNQIESFDIIYISFVLLHLNDPAKLLTILHRFLATNGKIMIIESFDRNSSLEPDDNNELMSFLDILSQDPCAGKRMMGENLPKILRDCGYQDVRIRLNEIVAENGEQEKKKAVFKTFLSYLPYDIALLLEQEPQNKRYLYWKEWMASHFEHLKEAVQADASKISMGIRIITCNRS